MKMALSGFFTCGSRGCILRAFELFIEYLVKFRPAHSVLLSGSPITRELIYGSANVKHANIGNVTSF